MLQSGEKWGCQGRRSGGWQLFGSRLFKLEDAESKFRKHEQCDFHKVCVEALSAKVNVGDMLNREAAAQKLANREYLLKILSSIRFLAQQALPLRGAGDEADSNIHQLLLLRGEDYPSILSYLGKKQLKYTSHEVHNELLSIMALQVLREIAVSLQNTPFLAVMADETTDKSNKEQVVLVLRWADSSLQVYAGGLHRPVPNGFHFVFSTTGYHLRYNYTDNIENPKLPGTV